MDGNRFDALTRGLDFSSRRRVLGAVAAIAFGAVSSLVDLADVEADKNKGKGKGKKKGSRCPSYAPKECGRDCCTRDYPKCCKEQYAPGGSTCYQSHYKCCPVEYGGGACTFNEECCPPRKGEIYNYCINPALGEHCCPLNSGGYCFPGSSCCPPELTNANNFGCCPGGRACCNIDGECPTGQRCSFGCCFSF
jgi:hypothetical protein